MQKSSNNWEVARLADIIVDIQTGKRPKGGIRGVASGVPSVGGEHLNNSGEFTFENIRYISEDFFGELKSGRIKKQDVLVVKDGATTGKVALVPDNFPFEKAAVNEHVFIIRANQNVVLPEYLFFFLFSPRGQAQILKNFHGSAIGGINTQFVKNVQVPVPPLSTQKKIVAILEKADSIKQKRKQAFIEASKLAQSVFIDMFGDPETNPKSWQVNQISRVASINPSKKELNDLPGDTRVSFIEMASVSEQGNIIRQDNKALCDVALGFTYFKDGDVLFAKITPCMENGKGAIAINLINGIGFGSTEFFVLRPNDRILPVWLHYLLMLKEIRAKAADRMTGSAGQKRVPRTFFDELAVPIPPIELQNIFTEICTKNTSMIEKQHHAQAKENELFQSLMQRAFSGELVA